jgi:hypothetical protein
VSALLHLLQHPNLRFGINGLSVDTLLGCLPKPLETHGRLRSRPRNSGSKFNSRAKQSIFSEIPAALKPRDRKLESRSRSSFAEIVKNEKTKRNLDFLLN